MLMRLRSEHSDELVKLFSVIREDPSAESFHPHDFNDTDALHYANYQGRDIYAGFFAEDQSLIAYGMLRGIDAGFDVPSLGIYVVPRARGQGVSQTVMRALHSMAHKDLGASKVRLKVYADNMPALKLYQKIGYQFESGEGNELVGIISLQNDPI